MKRALSKYVEKLIANHTNLLNIRKSPQLIYHLQVITLKQITANYCVLKLFKPNNESMIIIVVCFSFLFWYCCSSYEQHFCDWYFLNYSIKSLQKVISATATKLKKLQQRVLISF